MLTLSVVFVTAQATARCFASIVTVEPVGVAGLAIDDIRLYAKLGANNMMKNNSGNAAIGSPKFQNLLQKNIETGSLVVSGANGDCYSITAPASLMFQNKDEGNYLTGTLSINEPGAYNKPISLQMEMYEQVKPEPGIYNSSPAEITVNFN